MDLGRRQALADALREAFDGDDAHRDYARRLLACGLLHALNVAASATQGGTTDDLRRLLRALRAAGQLDAEIAAAGGLDPARQGMLDAAAVPLAAGLAALRVPDAREARRLAALVACRADRMGVVDAAAALDGEADRGTLAGTLADRVACAAALHRRLDRSIAGAAISRAIHRELCEADDPLRARIEARLAASSRTATTLGELIWRAPDAQTLHDLLAAHAPMGGQRMTVLALQVAGASHPELRRRAARTLAALREGGAALEAPQPGEQRRVPHADSEVSRLLNFLEDPRLRAVLAFDGNAAPGNAEPLLGVELGYFDPADVEARHIVALALDD